MATARWVFVVLDDRDFYGPHFDEVFVDLDVMRDYISSKYRHQYEYEVRVYRVNEGLDLTLNYCGDGVIK